MLTLTLTDYLSRGWFTAATRSTSAGAIISLSPKPQLAPLTGPAQNTPPK